MSVAAVPRVTRVGFTVRATVGAGATPALTATVADVDVVPPAPVQASVYVNAPGVENVAVIVPLSPWLPLHASLAAHEVALLDDHVNTLVAPTATEVGLALSVTVGLAVVAPLTVSCTSCGPTVNTGSGNVHDKMYVKVPVTVGATVSLPLAACGPLQPFVAGFTEAVHGAGGVLLLSVSSKMVP